MLLYLILFVAVCALLFAAAVVRPRLIYEFPYFMAGTFIAFILPQAYALYRNEWGGVYLETTLLMCCLCLAACWLGYLPRAHPAILEKFNVPVNTSRFLHGGIVLVLIGYYFTYKFATLPEDDIASSLTGIGTVYLFFGGLVYPGFAICFYCALKSRSFFMWAMSAVAAWIPLQAAIFYGRREPTALFLISLGMSLFFLRGKQASRAVVIGCVIGAMFIIPAIGEYRKTAAEDPIEAWRQLNVVQEFNEYFDVDATSELKNATVLIAATRESGIYEFGASYWNRIVFRFVPAQFVGESFKNSLMMGGVERDAGDFTEDQLGYRMPPGSTVTGIGDAFHEFSYLGCLFFAAMAYLFKNLWAATNQPNGTIAQVLYIQVTTSAMRALTHQTIDFLPGFIYSALFIALVAVYARERPAISKPALVRVPFKKPSAATSL
jgi:hypothetical protein